MENEVEGITLLVQLVGIKNLKTTHNWRLEFDVFEVDSNKVSTLIDKIEKAFAMALVENE
jgi:acyl carrier protein